MTFIFGIDQAELYRLVFLTAIFILLLATLGWHIYSDRSRRREQISALNRQADELEKALADIADNYKRETLERATEIGEEVKQETAARIDELRKRFDEVAPMITDTHHMVESLGGASGSSKDGDGDGRATSSDKTPT